MRDKGLRVWGLDLRSRVQGSWLRSEGGENWLRAYCFGVGVGSLVFKVES